MTGVTSPINESLKTNYFDLLAAPHASLNHYLDIPKDELGRSNKTLINCKFQLKRACYYNG